ncbi:type I restriction-modification system subunit M [Solirubrobacter phytolaccae]|uniref:site-specific DNA-methyltransferase (adenine-specific) n=1 Tax=Solirubrobacter phytolaccae TaxID=1404360 RepID=A0A9X3N8G2_9ACTN|nr:class I SAM-dependent DNA methyltransferase [Solirubrobacter phytolaccae]MDA0181718.1 type I restriction-modification system subunit M [Solirubrobacter phytolaccae]
MTDVKSHANLVWSIAELLRGDYKQADYGKVILPLVVIRRLDQTLEPTKARVVARSEELRAQGIENRELALIRVAKQQFYNDSPLNLGQLLGDAPRLAINLRAYLAGFSSLAREVVDKFDFDRQIDKLERGGLLYQVIARTRDVDLHPDKVSNLEMGYLFEELIRKFAEASNETAGEHFTPREVVRLMVNLLVDGDEDALSDPGVIRTVFDCACGTGGMLSEAEAHIKALNPSAQVDLFGQELNEESYAICLADMLVKGQDASHIKFGNSLSDDGHAGERFHYGIANPPFGVDWSKVESPVRTEHAERGFDGRFGPGLPRKSDGQLLFLLHLVSKMRPPEKGGSRIAIVHNGSPLFTGAAGSGESEIRRYLIENDLLEAIVALPEQLFYNTGISSYVWLLSNRKSEERRGKVQLIDARELFVKMRRSLGEKRREISPDQIEQITRLHGEFTTGDLVKIVEGASLGYRTITVEHPLRGRYILDTSAWNALPDDRAFSKLDDDTRSGLARVMFELGNGEVADEAELRASILRMAAARGVPKPGAPVIKALVSACLIRASDAPIVTDVRGKPVSDADRRDSENIALDEHIESYLDREVRPHVPGAWCSDPAGKTGYEIPFTRLFYKYTPPRPSAQIKAELRDLEGDIHRLLAEVLR